MTYTHHRIHRYGWYWHIRGFHGAGRNFLDIWFCTPITGKSFPTTVCHDPRSPREKDNSLPVGIRHIQTTEEDQCTVRECPLKKTESYSHDKKKHASRNKKHKDPTAWNLIDRMHRYFNSDYWPHTTLITPKTHQINIPSLTIYYLSAEKLIAMKEMRNFWEPGSPFLGLPLKKRAHKNSWSLADTFKKVFSYW